MPTETTDHSKPSSIDASATAKTDDTKSSRTDSVAKPITQRSSMRRRLLMGLGVLGLVLVLVFGVPWIRFVLSTVSTDDAFVNGHVTFVAPRVHGQVARVLEAATRENRELKPSMLYRM